MEYRIMYGKNVLWSAFLIGAFLLMIVPADVLARVDGGDEGRRVENSCLDCHRGLRGKLSAAVADWEKGVHAKAGVRCSWCHGGDPTSPDKKTAKRKDFGYVGTPAARYIPALCGKSGCHEVIYAHFLKSPHYESAMDKGEPVCSGCHGHHAIMKPTMEAISEKQCIACHSAGFSRGVLDELMVSGKKIDRLEDDLSFLKTKSVDISGSMEKLKQTRNNHLQAVHVMSRNEITYMQKIIGLELGSLGTDVALKMDANRRLDIIYLFTVVFVFAVTVFLGVYIVWILSRRND